MWWKGGKDLCKGCDGELVVDISERICHCKRGNNKLKGDYVKLRSRRSG